MQRQRVCLQIRRLGARTHSALIMAGLFCCAVELGSHAEEHSRVLCPDNMKSHSLVQRMFLRAHALVIFRARATHAQAMYACMRVSLEMQSSPARGRAQ